MLFLINNVRLYVNIILKSRAKVQYLNGMAKYSGRKYLINVLLFDAGHASFCEQKMIYWLVKDDLLPGKS